MALTGAVLGIYEQHWQVLSCTKHAYVNVHTVVGDCAFSSPCPYRPLLSNVHLQYIVGLSNTSSFPLCFLSYTGKL
jgi:hypothetical protein